MTTFLQLDDSDLIEYSKELYHHGIKGQKWGTRRFQNEDGSLTTLGRQHYYPNSAKSTDTRWKENEELHRKNSKAANDKLGRAVLGYYNITNTHANRDYWDSLKDIRTENKRYKTEKKKLKKENKLLRKNSNRKQAVEAYQKKYQELIGKSNKQFDKDYKKVSDNWNSLGKSEFGRRMKATFKKKDASVVAWKKSINDMMNNSKRSLQEWNDSNMKEMYKRTGSNAVSRIINNIKYDTIVKK
jgi:hypothetical protein